MELKIISIDDLTPLLSKGRKQADADRMYFRKWERGEITTADCIAVFRTNNDISGRCDISIPMFEIWLRSLGYVRRFR